MSDMTASTSGEQQQPFFTPPSLPKGGGTLTGHAGTLSAGGPDGGAGWQIPLPVSAAPARMLAPQMALSYSSGGGNGEFGMGWQLGQPTIRRRTQHGVPRYNETDRLSGPGGDELLRAPQKARTEEYLPFSESDAVEGPWTVTLFHARSGGLNTRTERWEVKGQEGDGASTFWIDFAPDGSLSLYGWSAEARLADPEDPSRVAEWRIEETVSARGEHILWRWRAEDTRNCSDEEMAQHPQVTNLYPDTVYWMNKTPSLSFLVPDLPEGTDAWQNDWLALLQFDYGERDTPEEHVPPFGAANHWPARPDALSFRRYGFEVRTRRLCHEVLLWHRTAMMADEASVDATPELVSRLRLTYDSTPVITQLLSAQTMAYEPADDKSRKRKRVATPPVEFTLTQSAVSLPDATAWSHEPAFDGFSHEYWQMADLYGDGIPGLLYRDGGAWWYRAPERKGEYPQLTPGLAELFDTPQNDAVTWGRPVTLPVVPSAGGAQIADLDGDGLPELVVALPGMRGSFTLHPDGQWGTFRPFRAFPSEADHPEILQTDLAGGGLTDFAMISPDGVRLWPSDGKGGWQAALNEAYRHDSRLPRPSGDGTCLVALSDITGGGLTELVEITADGVTVWPSLGHGRFGRPLSLKGFSWAQTGETLAFNPRHIYLADTDGTGVSDILVVGLKGIHVFSNESGNGFCYRGEMPPPEGVMLSEHSVLQVSDVLGLGMGSLVLTDPFATPRSWVLNFSEVRPWLLSVVTDNLGGRTELAWRSSAQAWLDEKAARLAAGLSAVSRLPFPVHTVSSVTQVNELTGLSLGSETRYLGGVWDGNDREFAGFRCVVQRDVNSRAQEEARQRGAQLSPPARTCTWYYAGVEDADKEGVKFARNDIDARFAAGLPRFTVWRGESDVEDIPEPGSPRRREMYRALRGSMMRTEVYGDDNSPYAGIPYSISRQRLQIRAFSSGKPDGSEDTDNPVTLLTPVETLSLSCERIAADPVVSQSLVLELDEYGVVLAGADITYPRQLTYEQVVAEEESRKHYPETDILPPGVIKESADTQQYDCWINLTRTQVHRLVTDDNFLPALPRDARTDVVWWGNKTGGDSGEKGRPVPEEGFTSDNLTVDMLFEKPEWTGLTGYSRTMWWPGTEEDTPTRQALPAGTETALLDEQSLAVLRPAFEETLADLVAAGLKTGSDPAVLTRLRHRLTDHVTPATFLGSLLKFARRQMAVLYTGCEDTAGRLLVAVNKTLDDALSHNNRRLQVITSAQLWTATGEADTPQAGNGFPRERLAEGVLAYLGSQGPEAPELHDLADNLLRPGVTPDILYWQVLSPDRLMDNPDLHALAMALAEPVQRESLETLLARSGYKNITIPLKPEISEVYGGRHNLTTYHDTDRFWLPSTVRESELLPETLLTYAAHDLMVIKATDGHSFVSEVTGVDWRFMAPVQVKDTNDNVSEASLDALGRVMHTRFYGTETPYNPDKLIEDVTPVATGYTATEKAPFTPPADVAAALALSDGVRNGTLEPLPVYQTFTTVSDSWMPLKPDENGQPTSQRIGAQAWQRIADRLEEDGLERPEMTGRDVPHVIHIQTDRYDNDPAQPVRVQVVRVQVVLHGGGQVLQTTILTPGGEALVRSEEGGLKAGEDGKAVKEDTTGTSPPGHRWAVTGRTEFDNKGNPVRSWLPFYLNDWRRVTDDSARDGIYADTRYYDAAGREYRVETAAGYERLTQIFPWFTLAWDENDTLKEEAPHRYDEGGYDE